MVEYFHAFAGHPIDFAMVVFVVTGELWEYLDEEDIAVDVHVVAPATGSALVASVEQRGLCARHGEEDIVEMESPGEGMEVLT